MLENTLNELELTTSREQWPLLKQVYLDLILAKMWKEVDVVPVEALSISVLVAHEPDTPADHRLVIIPVHQDSTSLSMNSLSSYFAGLRSAGLSNTKHNRGELQKLTLGILSPDSTVLYYHIYQGLVPPPV